MKLLFDNFDILAESPGGIKKLREMILQFAVQGKLVPQDPSDEPASVLLAKIKMEKERLVEEEKLKKQKPLEPIKTNVIPYELPDGWQWCRINTICQLLTGATPSRSRKDYFGGTIKWLVSGDIHQNIISNCKGRITEEGLRSSNCKILPYNSVMIALNGQGKTRATVALLRIEATCNQSLVAITTIDGSVCMPEYIFWNLRGRYFQLRDITGQKQRRGLNMKIIGNLLLSLPPLAEQKRIVAKVDSLMALCDILEKQQQDKALKKLTLNKASLHTLHNSTTKQNFTKNWNHITNNFGLLYSTPENVKELKQTVLQLAVQGKLVFQDPNDDPASVLLEKIRVEKERLVKEGKIKKQKPFEPIKADKIPFELPVGWEWCRLIDLVDVGTGSTPTKGNTSYYVNGTVPWYTSSATNNLYAKEPSTFITEKALQETNCKIFSKGSLIIAMYGQGKTRGQISEIITPGATNQAIAAMIFYDKSKGTRIYIKYYFRKIYHEIRLLAAGAAQPNLNVGKIKLTLVPLPPLAEQKRIVSKVDSLMALCDQLGDNLSNKEKMSGKMLSAVVSGL